MGEREREREEGRTDNGNLILFSALFPLNGAVLKRRESRCSAAKHSGFCSDLVPLIIFPMKKFRFHRHASTKTKTRPRLSADVNLEHGAASICFSPFPSHVACIKDGQWRPFKIFISRIRRGNSDLRFPL